MNSTTGVVVGQNLTILVAGFASGEPVTVTVHSTPRALAPAKADAKGVVSYAFTVPAGLTVGEHTLEFAAKSKTMAWQFTVTAKPAVLGEATARPTPSAGVSGAKSGSGLPSTGTEIALLGLTGLFLLGAGAAAIAYARRCGFRTFKSIG